MSAFYLDNEDLPTQIVEHWNSKLGLVKVTQLGARRKVLIGRLKDQTFREQWKQAIDLIGASKFCCGLVCNWRASFGWFLEPENFEKVLAGNYANKDKKPASQRAADDGRHYAGPSQMRIVRPDEE